MAKQVITLDQSWFDVHAVYRRWQPPVASRPQITGDIAGGQPRYLENITFRGDASAVVLNIAAGTSSPFSQAGNLRLSSLFETQGSVTLDLWDATSNPDSDPPDHTWTVQMGGRDTSEPYRINFAAGSADKTAYDAFFSTLQGFGAGTARGRLTLDDGQAPPVPPPPAGTNHDITITPGAGTITGGAVTGAQPTKTRAPVVRGQDITLGNPTTQVGVNVVEWSGSYGPIQAEILVGTSAQALTYLAFNSDGSVSLSIAGNGEIIGDIETSGTALKIAAGGEEWIIPGPNAAGVQTRDSSEPYYWLPGSAFDVPQFLTDFAALSDKSATLTIQTPQANYPISVTPGAGTITGGAVTGLTIAVGTPSHYPISVTPGAGTITGGAVTGLTIVAQRNHPITVTPGTGRITGGRVTGLTLTAKQAPARNRPITVTPGAGTITGGAVTGLTIRAFEPHDKFSQVTTLIRHKETGVVGTIAWQLIADIEDGRDGEEGFGIEYIFTSSADGEAITGAANLPLGTWAYDPPALADGITRGEQTYYDGLAKDLGAVRKYSHRFRRAVPATVVAGQDIGDVPWTQEASVQVVGVDGIPGATWHTAAGDPADDLGKDGDLYLNTTSYEIFRKADGKWASIGSVRGADGATWFTGAAAPTDALGSDDDWYFQTGTGGVAGSIYRKVSGAWVKQVDIDQGDDGNTWLAGAGAPSTALGKVGDLYFRTSNGYVYEKTADETWTFRRDLTGPQGIGGATWHTGTGAPGSALGVDNDLYFRTDTAQVYQKTSGSWASIANLSGADGATWTSGSGAPSDADGKDDDWYFRSGSGAVAGTIYKKVSGAWVKQVDIDQGADGAVWHSGTAAPANNLGNKGDWYFRSSNGFVYEKTAANAWTFRRDITGPQGIAGAVWHTATGQPASGVGAKGDFAIVTSGGGIGDVYEKTDATTWTKRANLKGADGDAGGTWHTGSSAPASSLGEDGNFYFQTGATQAAGTIYTKQSGSWVKLFSADGTASATWHSGDGVPAGSLGRVGDWYFRTANGHVYEKTAASTWTFRRDITGPAGEGGLYAGTPYTEVIWESADGGSTWTAPDSTGYTFNFYRAVKTGTPPRLRGAGFSGSRTGKNIRVTQNAAPQGVNVVGTYVIRDNNTPKVTVEATYEGLVSTAVFRTRVEGAVDTTKPPTLVGDATVTCLEGGPDVNYTLSLSHASTSAITVDVEGVNTSEYTVTPTRVVFAAGQTSKTFRFRGVRDTDERPETDDMTFEASGGSTDELDVRVIVNEIAIEPGLNVNVEVEEGAHVDFPISLSHLPRANVTITTDGVNTNDITVTPSSRTYTPRNATTPQNFRITGVDEGSDVFYFEASGAIGYELRIDVDVVAAGVTTSRPGAPTGVTGTARSSSRIDISWTAPSSDGGEAITGYEVQRRREDGVIGGLPVRYQWSDVSHTGTSTSASATGLVANTGYYLRVAAVNSNGRGPWSSEAYRKTQAGGTSPPPPPVASAPSAPRNLAATARSATSIRLTWTAPSTTGGSTVTYKVEYKLRSANSWTQSTASQTGRTRTISSLTAGEQYDFRVTASNDTGTGGVATASAYARVAPGLPRNIVATVESNTSISLTWDAPTDDGGDTVTDYDVRYREVDEANWLSRAHTGTTRSTTVTGLTKATEYEFQVRAENNAGDGAWSTSVKATTTGGTPANTLPGAPTGLSGSWVFYPSSDVGDIQLPAYILYEAEWTAPSSAGASALNRYEVDFGTLSGSTFTSKWPHETMSTTNGVLDTELSDSITDNRATTIGSVTHLRARAGNSSGWGPWSAVVAVD